MPEYTNTLIVAYKSLLFLFPTKFGRDSSTASPVQLGSGVSRHIWSVSRTFVIRFQSNGHAIKRMKILEDKQTTIGFKNKMKKTSHGATTVEYVLLVKRRGSP